MKQLITAAAAVALATSLAACGATGTPQAVQPQGAAMNAQAAASLKKTFTRIHKAIFTTMDADGNGWLDEYEAGKHMSMRDFGKADKAKGWGSANRLSRNEFVNWATHSFLWFRDTPDSFARRMRGDLGRVFNRLDENNDDLLANREVSNADLKRLRLTFEYPKLNVKVPIKAVSDADFGAADKTGDGKLSQAEFEHLYLEMVVTALGGEGGPAPAPVPADEPPMM